MLVSELWIKNFKSLRDIKLRLSQFNLVVGPNGSGKTNLIDALEFFRDALTTDRLPRPWRKWWRPENIVWMRDESLPLAFGFKLSMDELRVTYEVTCSVTGGEFRIEQEVLDIEGWGRLERAGRTVSVSYEEEFIEKAKRKGIDRDSLKPKEARDAVRPWESIVQYLARVPLLGEIEGEELQRVYLYLYPGRKRLPVVVPIVGRKALKELRRVAEWHRPLILLRARNMLGLACIAVASVIDRITIVRPINLQAVKKPQEYAKTLRLASDCSNLYIVLYNLFLKHNRLPDRIARILRMAFEDYDLFFDLTEDGRVFVKLARDELTLPPPCMPDGFHKLVAILTALELKPSILVVIATTHSPAAVDIADPEDLVLASMTVSGTEFRRLKDPAKIKEELRRYGITLSERWLWGRMEVE